MKWQIDIGIILNCDGMSPFTVKGDWVFELEKGVCDVIGRKEDASGCGCGFRDFQIMFPTKVEAEKAKKKVKSFLKSKNYKFKKDYYMRVRKVC